MPGAEGFEGQQGAAHLVAAGHLHPRRQKALQRVDDDEAGAAFPTYFAKLVSGMQSGLPVRAK